ncbi:MAG: FG-GAP-like repeat-containing protein [Candidatus Tenebribacter mawsonii]|nr:FG-GAP-like repeat-containing protein [Candidatus Tenebribacter mawsonii]
MKKIALILVFMICTILAAQEFTQITTGDIVNDGGWNYACCWADFNGDGYDDLFVCNNDADNGKHNFLYFNNGDGSFTKITEGDIITDGNSSYGCAAADYDNDGDIDLFVSNYNENNCLYANNGDGTFTKITTGSIVTNSGKSTGCEWIDYDKDGWLDLFICNRDEPNFLYNNNGDETFTRITGQLLVTESRNSGNCCWADYDDNGYPDVFIANSGPDYNSLFLNNGDGTFAQVTGDPIVSDLESFDICCTGDIDNDGDFDVFTAPGMLPASSYDLYLYQNNGNGTFIRIPNLPHSGLNSGGGGGMIDYDNDGDLDIFESAYDGTSILLQNDGNGNFTQITTGVLVNSGSYNKEPSWTDYDLDGDIDVFFAVNNYFSGNNKFFTNDGNTNFWIYIDLEGTESNINGIDALITLTANINGQDVTQTKRVSDKNSLTTHFGVMDDAIIDEILVNWPSGNVTTLNDVIANQYLIIQEVIELDPPTDLAVESNPADGFATFTWEAPIIDDLTGYDIYLDSVIQGNTIDLEWLFYDLENGTLYEAGVVAVYDEGTSEMATLEFVYEGTGTSNDLPLLIELKGNFPNPFNPETTIRFETANLRDLTRIEIYNLKGQKIKTLISEQLSPGQHSVVWHGTNESGKAVTSGVYLYKMKSGDYQKTRKMILMK